MAKNKINYADGNIENDPKTWGQWFRSLTFEGRWHNLFGGIGIIFGFIIVFVICTILLVRVLGVYNVKIGNNEVNMKGHSQIAK